MTNVTLEEVNCTELKQNWRVPIIEDDKFIGYKYFKLGEKVEGVSDAEQCIGKKDRNGKLIYENDILKVAGTDKKATVQVIYFNMKYGFSIRVDNEPILLEADLSNIPSEQLLVVGSYWENK